MYISIHTYTHTHTHTLIHTHTHTHTYINAQVLLDLLLLARADALVLHLASNFSRLALTLAIAHHRGVRPFISVDGPMCYHWQICCVLAPDASSTMC